MRAVALVDGEHYVEVVADALAAGDGDWRPAGVERAQFRRFVRPGDQMELSVEVVDRIDGEVTLSAKVHVGGKLAARIGALRLKEAA